MLRWMSDPNRRPRRARTSQHGYPKGFDKPSPTETSDPYWEDHGHDHQDGETDGQPDDYDGEMET
jgi:hypothetical protein